MSDSISDVATWLDEVANVASRYTVEELADVLTQARDRLLTLISLRQVPEAAQVTCQIYGHVVGCAECNATGTLENIIREHAEGLASAAAALLAALPEPTPAQAGAVDGEAEAFEAWAVSQRYDMHTHPLHWLFLNQETYAARQGWKAGLAYANSHAQAGAELPAPEYETILGRMAFTADQMRLAVKEQAERAEVAEARVLEAEGMLREALPFIGWTGAPDGMINRIAAFLDANGETK